MLFIYRTIKFAWQGFIRNFWLSLVTIIILVVTLFSVTLVAGINVIADQAIKSVQSKVDVSVYFKSEVGEKDVLSVRDRLSQLSEVDKVTYVSQATALENFKKEHANDPLILESIEQQGSNPLFATLIIKAKTIDDYPAIMSFLDQPDYSNLIDDKNYADNEKVINNLSNISDKIQHVGIIVSAIFVIIAVLIIFNTIRINIYTHREEIGIMKLVGASNWFVRAPFLLESLMYALLAVVVCIAILYPVLGVIAPQINNFFTDYSVNIMDYFNQHFWRIIGWQCLLALVLSMFSSGIAIGRYMKV